jgi:hypothetical protein
MDKHAVLPNLDMVHNGPLGLDRSGNRTGPLLLLRPTRTGPDRTRPDRGNTSPGTGPGREIQPSSNPYPLHGLRVTHQECLRVFN